MRRRYEWGGVYRPKLSGGKFGNRTRRITYIKRIMVITTSYIIMLAVPMSEPEFGRN